MCYCQVFAKHSCTWKWAIFCSIRSGNFEAVRLQGYTREALLSEAGFEKVFRTQNWVRRRKLFCRWFGFLLGQAGCISVAAWTQLVEGSFLLFRFVWWLDCLLLKEGASAFCSLRWLLEVFLAVAEFVGFREGGRLPFEWLYWIFYCPCWSPLPF